MANHHILTSQGVDVSSEDTWYALTTAELPDGITLNDISLLELLHKPEKLDVLLPLTDLLDAKNRLAGGLMQELYQLIAQHSSRLGIWLTSNTDADALAGLSEFLLTQTLIVIYVPLFADGRDFSFVQTLRQLGYQGEIRIAGAFGRDQIAYLLRVGADSFVINEHDVQNGSHSDISQAFTALASSYNGQNVSALPMFAGA